MSTGTTGDAKPDCLSLKRRHVRVTVCCVVFDRQTGAQLLCFTRKKNNKLCFGAAVTFLNEVSSLTLTNPSLLRRTCLSRKASCSRFSSDR